MGPLLRSRPEKPALPEPVALHPLPLRLVTEAVEDGWIDLPGGLLATDVELHHPRTARGVWICARSARSLDLIRPLGHIPDDEVPPRLLRRVSSLGGFERLGGVLAAVGLEPREADYRRVRSTVAFLAHLPPGEPWELDLRVGSGWLPRTDPGTARVGPWWERPDATAW